MPNLTSFSSVSLSATHVHEITSLAAEAPGVTVQMGLSVTIGIKVGRPIGESFSLLDSPVTVHRKFVRGVSESITIEEDTTRFMRANIVLGESFTILHEAIRRLVQSKSAGETLNIVALTSRGLFVPRIILESLTINTSVVGQRLTFFSRSVSESLVVAEDGFVRWCSTAGQLKKIIRHQLGRFFSVLPQRNIRSYTFDSNLIREKEKQQ